MSAACVSDIAEQLVAACYPGKSMSDAGGRYSRASRDSSRLTIASSSVAGLSIVRSNAPRILLPLASSCKIEAIAKRRKNIREPGAPNTNGGP